METSKTYRITGLIFGIPCAIAMFIYIWIAAIGFFGLLGFGFGWLPAAVLAVATLYVVGHAWPILAIGIVLMVGALGFLVIIH